MKRFIIAILILWALPAWCADKLLTESDFTRAGAFKLPANTNGPDYGGRSLGWNPANNSLYVGGYNNGYVAEINTDATPSSATSVGSLPECSYRQNFYDVTEGHFGQIGAGGSSSGMDQIEMRGLLVYNGYLYGSEICHYESPTASFNAFFRHSLTLSTSSFLGHYGLHATATGFTPRFVGMGMSIVPTAYQERLGGKALTSATPRSIISTRSYGPTVSVFDPESLGTASASTTGQQGSCTMLIGYHQEYGEGSETNPEAASCFNSPYTFRTNNSWYSSCDQPAGVFIPAGSCTLVFIGVHGTGSFCYGTAPSPCTDSLEGASGNHNYPYVTYCWLYDIGNADGSNTTGNTVSQRGYTSGTMYNTVTAVKLGTIGPDDIKPYEAFELTSPFGGSGVEGYTWGNIQGLTIDPATNRVYGSRYYGGSGTVIDVFDIDTEAGGEAPPPPTLSNVTISGGSFR